VRVLVYDGDCALCVAASQRLVSWAGLPDERRRSHAAFEGEAFERLLAAGVHDELAVLEEATGEIRSGVPGILWWLRDGRLARAAALLDRPAIRALLVPLYRLVARNRRILAPPPPRPIPCACDPTPHAGYQGAFAALLGAAGLAGAMGAIDAGARIARSGPGAATGPGTLALCAAPPILLAGLLSLRLPAGRRLAGLAHRLWPFAAAAPVFLLADAAARLLPAPGAPLATAALLAAGAFALGRSTLRRARILAAWRG
jgi:hypothetical protein